MKTKTKKIKLWDMQTLSISVTISLWDGLELRGNTL